MKSPSLSSPIPILLLVFGALGLGGRCRRQRRGCLCMSSRVVIRRWRHLGPPPPPSPQLPPPCRSHPSSLFASMESDGALPLYLPHPFLTRTTCRGVDHPDNSRWTIGVSSYV